MKMTVSRKAAEAQREEVRSEFRVYAAQGRLKPELQTPARNAGHPSMPVWP